MSAEVILAGTFLILLSQPVKDLVEISIGVVIGMGMDTALSCRNTASVMAWGR